MPQIDNDLIMILKVLKDEGGTDCTGTCHHRKPGEFHCHVFGRKLKLSSQGIKNRLLTLMRMGLVRSTDSRMPVVLSGRPLSFRVSIREPR